MNSVRGKNQLTFQEKYLTKLIRQGATLSFATALTVVFGFILSIINTHYLSTSDYGRYKLLGSFFALFTTITSFGFFVSSGRLVSIQLTDKAKRNLIGAATVIGSFVALVYVLLLVVSLFVKGFFYSSDLINSVYPLLPLLIFVPFKMLLDNLLQGDNKVKDMSILRIAPITFQILITIVYIQFADFSSDTAILFQLVPICLFVMIILRRLRPKFVDLAKNFKIIWDENKKYGFSVYHGALANTATLQIAPLLIAYYLGNMEVGFFALSITIAGPLAIVPSAFGSASFKNFASQSMIPRHEMRVTVLITISLVLLFNSFIGFLIFHVYPSDFSIIIPFVRVISIGAAFRGLGDYLNRFLGAHGRGKDIRNAAFMNGVVNITGYAFVVPFFGLWGAIFTNATSDIVYASAMYFYYRGERHQTNR